MSDILSIDKSHFVFVYRANVVTFSRIPERPTERTGKRLSLLNSAKISLELDKSNLTTNNIDNSGYEKLPRRLKLSSHTADAISLRKLPTKNTKLKPFLAQYRRLVMILFMLCAGRAYTKPAFEKKQGANCLTPNREKQMLWKPSNQHS